MSILYGLISSALLASSSDILRSALLTWLGLIMVLLICAVSIVVARNTICNVFP